MATQDAGARATRQAPTPGLGDQLQCPLLGKERHATPAGVRTGQAENEWKGSDPAALAAVPGLRGAPRRTPGPAERRPDGYRTAGSAGRSALVTGAGPRRRLPWPPS
jgi:hypothetical protein